MPQDATKTPVEVIDERPVKLDLASGQTPREGFTGVDLFTGDNRVDLLSFPWPWADGSVDAVHCSHFVEHIPMAYIDADNREHARAGLDRKDLFCAFFDEVHRILKPGGKATIIVPYGRHSRGFQDPTHRRFIVEETFLYLNAEWRAANKLEHYLGRANFVCNVMRIVDASWSVRTAEVLGQAMTEKWNVITDLQVEMVKL